MFVSGVCPQGRNHLPLKCPTYPTTAGPSTEERLFRGYCQGPTARACVQKGAGEAVFRLLGDEVKETKQAKKASSWRVHAQPSSSLADSLANLPTHLNMIWAC